MNECDFSDSKKETIKYKGINLENLFFSLVSDGLWGYRAIYCALLC